MNGINPDILMTMQQALELSKLFGADAQSQATQDNGEGPKTERSSADMENKMKQIIDAMNLMQSMRGATSQMNGSNSLSSLMGAFFGERPHGHDPVEDSEFARLTPQKRSAGHDPVEDSEFARLTPQKRSAGHNPVEESKFGRLAPQKRSAGHDPVEESEFARLAPQKRSAGHNPVEESKFGRFAPQKRSAGHDPVEESKFGRFAPQKRSAGHDPRNFASEQQGKTPPFFNNEIHMPALNSIKAAIPQLDNRYRRYMSIFVKLIEIQKMMELYSQAAVSMCSGDAAAKGWQKCMLEALRPHMDKEKAIIIDFIVKMIDVKEITDRMHFM